MATHSLRAPAQIRTDSTIKLAVLIAAGEATANEALASRSVYSCELPADLSSLPPNRESLFDLLGVSCVGL